MSKPAFDPNAPFEVAPENAAVNKPPFDPNAPFEAAPEPNMSAAKAVLDKNLADSKLSASGEPKIPTPDEKRATLQKPAESFLDDWLSGWQASNLGLITRGKVPDTILPEDANFAARMLHTAGQLTGDSVSMLAGAFAGGVVGGPAAPITSPAGAWALPAALRKVLMDHYEKGDIQDFTDFYQRAGGAFVEGLKSGVVGAATGGAGVVAGKLVSAASPLVRATAITASEVATMTTVGKAMEGEVPKLQDFTDGAFIVGALHVATKIPAPLASKVSAKLRNVYSETGVKPQEIIEQVKTDQTIQQDLLSVNKPMPDAYKRLAEEHGVPINSELAVPKAAKGLTDEALPKRSEATDKILSKVGDKEVKSSYLDSIVADAKETKGKSDAYENFVDKLDPINRIEKMVDEKIETFDSGYQLSRMVNDAKAKVKYVIEKGNIDFNTRKTVGKSLEEIISPFKKDRQEFSAYLISKRVIEKEAQGFKTGFDLEAAKAVVAEGSKKYGKAQKEFVEWNNKNLEYLKDSGVLSKDVFEKFKSLNENYVSFARIIETEEGVASGKGKSSSLKAFKGSEANIQDPLISALENTTAIFRMAEKNRAVLKLVENVEKTPELKGLLEKVESDVKMTKVQKEEVANFFKEQGIDAEPEAFSIFRRQQKTKLAENEFEVFRNGKREVWKTEDLPLARAIKSLDGDVTSQNMVMKLARAVTTVKKIGITLDPAFAVKNFLRDQISAKIFSKEERISIGQVFTAMGDIIGKKEAYYDWMKSGGFGGNYLEINESYLNKNIYKLQEETNFMSTAFNVVKKPLDYVEAMGILAEQATRLSEFKRVAKGASEGPDLVKAGFAAREVTVDFQRVGAKIAALNAMTAFMNPSIQGLDRTVRSFKEEPAAVGMKALTSITVPSILIWWANRDNEAVKEVPRWQKDLFWIIPLGDKPDSPIMRIPKPQELGIMFGSMVERTLDAFFTDNPQAYKDFDKTMRDLVTPSFIPDIAQPVVETWANKSLFTGNPIIPHSVEGVLPQEQYTEYTSETAKKLGKLITFVPWDDAAKSPMASPVVIDNFIRSWGGSLGQYALQIADAGLGATGMAEVKNKPTNTWSDTPFFKSFAVRYPSAGSKSIGDFYENFKSHEQVINTLTKFKNEGNVEKIIELVGSVQTANKLMSLKGPQGAISALQSQARSIYLNKKMPPDDKRQLLDRIYFGMIQTAKAGNKIAAELSKGDK